MRATKDLDIVPNPDPENFIRLAAALRDLEAEPDLGELDQTELDIVPDEQGSNLGGNWVQQLRAGAIDVGDVLYAGYDELISMKAASGRDEDLRDIGALEAARGN